METLKKLFGGGNQTNSNSTSNQDDAITWPAKFLLLSITETSGEAPSLEDIKEVLQNTFQNFTQSKISEIHVSIMALHKKSNNTKNEWDKIWDDFSSQLKTFKLSETFSSVQLIASNAFNLKMAEGMEDVAQNYVYRMSQFEKYLQISKSDYLAIIEEEKENTGYNAYINNL